MNRSKVSGGLVVMHVDGSGNVMMNKKVPEGKQTYFPIRGKNDSRLRGA